MNIKSSILIAAVLFISTILNAQNREYFEYRTFNYNKQKMPYRLLKPYPINDNEKYPLIIFLHSEKLKGSDNEKQINHFVQEFAKEKKRKKYPAIVIAPQIQPAKKWTSARKKGAFYSFSRMFNTQLSAVNALIEKTVNDFPVDTEKIYVIGISEGGTASLEWLNNAGKVKGIISICPNTNIRMGELSAKTKVWIISHKKADNTLTSSLKQNNITYQYSQLSGSPNDCLKHLPVEEIFRWLFLTSK